jgi:MYND finger
MPLPPTPTLTSPSPPLYDGTCLELSEYHCAACGKTESKQDDNNDEDDAVEVPTLVRCSRCCIMRYCNVECQRRDYVVHREGCLAVQESKKKLEQLAAPLRSFNLPDSSSTTNLFETRVGGFWVRSRACADPRDQKRALSPLIL